MGKNFKVWSKRRKPDYEEALHVVVLFSWMMLILSIIAAYIVNSLKPVLLPAFYMVFITLIALFWCGKKEYYVTLPEQKKKKRV